MADHAEMPPETAPAGPVSLIAARQALALAVLRAVSAGYDGDFSDKYTAWKAVDEAAMSLARARRSYDRHVKAVLAAAGEVPGG